MGCAAGGRDACDLVLTAACIRHRSCLRIYFFRGVPKLAYLVEMILQIMWDMLAFMTIVSLLIAAFGLAAFVLHSTHPEEVEGSFSTPMEALFTTVRCVPRSLATLSCHFLI